MEQYPSNAHKPKEATATPISTEKQIVKPVVSGSASVKKKSGIKKFGEAFLAEDIHNVGIYIVSDVLIPAFKKAIYDVVTNGLDMLLYKGEVHSKRTAGSKVNYGGMYRREDDRRDRPSQPRVSSGLDYDCIEFDTRGDAEAVLTAMEEIIEQFGKASVGDLYDLSDISTNNYAINKYGWCTLQSAYVDKTRYGKFYIKLPRALPLD